MRVVVDDLTGEKIQALLAYHLAAMHENSPPDCVYALDLSGLKAPEVTVWTAWDGEDLLGCGALKALALDRGEIKSMRTDPCHVRKGVGAAILDHIINVARQRGYRRLSLETGTGAAFEPARALYLTRGFIDGARYGDYVENAFSRYMHLDID